MHTYNSHNNNDVNLNMCQKNIIKHEGKTCDARKSLCNMKYDVYLSITLSSFVHLPQNDIICSSRVCKFEIGGFKYFLPIHVKMQNMMSYLSFFFCYGSSFL